jgi:membrane associated rhomboid family serine protease
MKVVLGYGLAICVVSLVNLFVFKGALSQYGINAQMVDFNLIGIATHPFLHASINHLVGNIHGYLFLGFIRSVQSKQSFHKDFWLITAISGILTWMSSPKGVVGIGASGVVSGLFGLVVGRGVKALANKNFRQGFGDILFMALAIATCGGMFFGMLPIVPKYIGWQAHLTGFLVGCFLGWNDD